MLRAEQGLEWLVLLVLVGCGFSLGLFTSSWLEMGLGALLIGILLNAALLARVAWVSGNRQMLLMAAVGSIPAGIFDALKIFAVGTVVRWGATVLFLSALLGVQPARDVGGLDDRVRGERPADLWRTLDGDFKYAECLHHKVSVMRGRAGAAKGPAELVSYYPNWIGELDDCGRLYRADPKRSERLKEALSTKMAVVLGEETSSYLAMQRLYADQAPSGQVDWLDRWRATAIIGVAGVADLLEAAQ